MKKLCLFICICSLAIELNAQSNSTAQDAKKTSINHSDKPIAPNPDSTFVHVEVKAKPDFNYIQYLQTNLIYPDEALENGVQGKITVMFVVELNGMISNVKVIKGEALGHGLPEEALRVVKKMPKWQPAMHKGKVVRSYYTLPINFKLVD